MRGTNTGCSGVGTQGNPHPHPSEKSFLLPQGSGSPFPPSPPKLPSGAPTPHASLPCRVPLSQCTIRSGAEFGLWAKASLRSAHSAKAWAWLGCGGFHGILKMNPSCGQHGWVSSNAREPSQHTPFLLSLKCSPSSLLEAHILFVLPRAAGSSATRLTLPPAARRLGVGDVP